MINFLRTLLPGDVKHRTQKILFLTLLFINITGISYSADPTYEINTSNFNFIASNILEFDIFLKHTNPAESTFEYSMGQYVFNFNTGFANGGTLTYSYSPDNPVSDLPINLRPRNPKVSVNQLRLASNTPPGGFGFGYMISSTGNGTLIARMRLRTSAGSFAGTLVDLNLTLRGIIDGGFYTKIAAYVLEKAKNITLPTSINENLISGKAFFDYNNNGLLDINEFPFLNAIISTTPFTSYSSTSYNGNYFIGCGTGVFNVSVQNVPLHYSLSPLTHTANFSGIGETQAGLDFALVPNSPVNDLKISLSNMTSRPGFNAFQYINYTNLGTTTISGSIELLYDANLTFLFAAPEPESHNSTTHTLVWNYSNILPGQSARIQIMYNLPSIVALGTILTSNSTIYPVAGDYNPFDNTSQVNDIVRGSYDPNDKNVDLIGKITPEEVADEDSLTYTVRFQNTGTDTAFTVRVLDTLSSKMNVPSIEMLASSHDYTYTITGAGIVEWTFNNILLPDSTTNEPASHGFIKYRVRPKNNLVLGDEIKNTAYIYFDYNVPVVTNTVNTVVGYNSKFLDLSCRLQAMFPVPDTLSVYMRNTVAPYEIVDSAKVYTDAALPDFYKIVISFENIIQGSTYYLTVNHRNSIETWSANPIMINSDTTVYDFTSSANQAYGDNMIPVSGRYCIYGGDVNQNGVIDGSDLLMIVNDAASSVTGYVLTDVNGDGIVDGSDALVADNNAANFVTKITP